MRFDLKRQANSSGLQNYCTFFSRMATLIAMRPLFHPSIEEITVEGILHALSDPVRVAIYADIVSQECSQNCSTFLTVSRTKIGDPGSLSTLSAL